MSRFLWALLFVISLACCSCAPPPSSTQPGFLPVAKMGGVKIKGEWQQYRTLHLTNTNEFDVRVRVAQRSTSHGRGEETICLLHIKPNATKVIDAKYNLQLYIHQVGTGELIGFCNQELLGTDEGP